jgi:branched-chain amino acid transport system ATP-binding protein
MRAPSARDVAAGEVLLSVERVSLAFGGVRALVEVSFDIRKGEIRAIIGPNGAGKTSMLNVINGFYQPQDGQIIFRGEARRKMRPYEAVDQAAVRPHASPRVSCRWPTARTGAVRSAYRPRIVASLV